MAYPITRNRVDEKAPFQKAKVVIPHATNAVPGGICRAIYVGGTGNVALITSDDDTPIFYSVPAGTTLHVYTTRVLATGTTATNMLALS